MTTLSAIIFVFSVITANALLYLSNRHQACLSQPLAFTPWFYCGCVIHLHAFFIAYSYLNPLAASFAHLITTMLSLGLIPFVSLLVGKKSHDTRHR
ncbi:hypothetical protein [Undibacterium danionis]|uniref:Uncharacterized protein n=1 Tax=Undibacterium danionis TaxID=1812100 RepID=A0ABV6IEU1_9BURK